MTKDIIPLFCIV